MCVHIHYSLLITNQFLWNPTKHVSENGKNDMGLVQEGSGSKQKGSGSEEEGSGLEQESSGFFLQGGIITLTIKI